MAKAIVRKWGNSKPRAGVLFGRFPRKSGRTAQELKDEARRGWASRTDK